MDRQEAYEAVRAYFTRPGAVLGMVRGRWDYDKERERKSILVLDEEEDLTCVYRSPVDPTIRCSVGALIPDDLYDVKMENEPIVVLLGEWPALKELLPDETFLDRMQDEHDHSLSVRMFLDRLDALATDCGLRVVA